MSSREKQQITIESDGTIVGTNVRTKSGERLSGVTKIEVILDANKNIVEAKLTFARCAMVLRGLKVASSKRKILKERVIA